MKMLQAICSRGHFYYRWLEIMSKNYEDLCNEQNIQNRVCSVAYTLNDFQPVISTHIGDQPFFYMDEEDIIDEDDGYSVEELEILAREIKALQGEVAALENTSEFMPEDTMKLYTYFSENTRSLSEEEIYTLTAQEQVTRLAKIKEILGESRLAAAYLTCADKHDVSIKLCDQVQDAVYDRRSGTILLYPHMDMNEQILLTVRELRRHWQHRSGALINPLMFQPENAILINRALEADLVVSVIRIAWELQLAGLKDVWERVETSSLSDLSRSFAREAFMDFRTINDGTAAAAVFEAWFLSERCRQQDKKIIQAMLADYNGYVFSNDEASKQVSLELIAALGEMPFGKNYLATYANTIMDDPIFAEARDRSAANFLWFIKFERAFKETEQELQTESDLSTRDIRHDLLNDKSQGPIDDNKQSADVIQLFEFQDKQESKSRGANQSGSADVIHLSRWSAKS